MSRKRSHSKRSKSHTSSKSQPRSKSRTRSKTKTPSRRSKSPSRSHTKKEDWELLIRVTDGLSLSFLASLKGLYPQIDSGWMPGIYTHYLSSKMDSTLVKNSCMRTDLGNFVLVFHPDILKDLSFSVCNANMQGRCIHPSIEKKVRDELLLMDSPGNLQSKPNMATLSNWVNFYLDPETTDPRVDNRGV